MRSILQGRLAPSAAFFGGPTQPVALTLPLNFTRS